MLIQWIKKVALVAACVVSFGAQAAVITDTVNVNEKVNAFGSSSWTHDINDQGFVWGTAESAVLSIEFSDKDRLPELATIIVGTIDFLDGAILFEPDSYFTTVLGFNSLASLNANGTLDVFVQSTFFGAFYIGASTLDVTISNVASVPESSSLMLFALGLLGLVALRKRKAA